MGLKLLHRIQRNTYYNQQACPANVEGGNLNLRYMVDQCVDDNWQNCHGSQKYRTEEGYTVKNLIQEVKGWLAWSDAGNETAVFP